MNRNAQELTRWDPEAIEYTDVDKIRAALVGRSIIDTRSDGADYSRVLTFVLDDGTLLRAHATDGGCACSNGCFSVEAANTVRGTILNVEVKEFRSDYQGGIDEEVTPGTISDGSAVIRIFVYSSAGEHLLLQSEDGDNGYYGWGFWLSVVPGGES